MPSGFEDRKILEGIKLLHFLRAIKKLLENIHLCLTSTHLALLNEHWPPLEGQHVRGQLLRPLLLSVCDFLGKTKSQRVRK